MSERFRVRRQTVPEEVTGPSFRCGQAARGLPRVLGAATLVAALVAAYQLPATRLVKASHARECVAAIGVLAAVWFVRTGRELHTVVTVGQGSMQLAMGTRRRRVSLESIESMVFRPPFADGRRWVPALVLADERGDAWRVPALLEGGAELVGELLTHAGRSDLRAWAQARKIEDRMSRAGQWVVVGYGVALAIVAAAVLLFLVRS